MAKQAFDHDMMVSSLQDVRLPTDAPGGTFAEIAAVVGLGLSFALLLNLALRWFVRRQQKARSKPTLNAQIAAATALPEQDRVLALLKLAQSCAPEVLTNHRDRLYARDGLPTSAALEALLRKAERESA